MRFKYFIIPVIFLIWACEKNQTDENICYTISERQCAMDPYSSFIQDSQTDSDKAKGIKKYFEAQYLKVDNIIINAPSNLPVCLACICPSGKSFQITISASDTTDLKKLDLLTSQTSCD